MQNPTLSIVLPCFNEQETIENTVADVMSWMQRTAKKGEIIVVNDGSRDRSGEILEAIARQHPMVKIITHEKNQGYGLAIRSGCDAANFDVIGFMDSDGQFKPEDFDKLLPRLEESPFVTGRRQHRADSFIRNMFGKILGGMNVVLLGLWVRDVNCGMKVFTRDVWKIIRPVHGVEKLFNTEMFLRLKYLNIPWITVDIPHYPRRAGTPTGGSPRVILRMFKEMWDLKRRMH